MAQKLDLLELLGDELVYNGSESGELKRMKTASLLQPDAIVGLYFSAHWYGSTL